jgi:hypothetical protein
MISRFRTTLSLTFLCLLAAPLAGCDDADDGAPAADGGLGDAGLSDAGAPTAGGPRGIAIVMGDYMNSAAVSLYDPAAGAVIKDNCVGSGTRAPQLSVALSSDLTLPSRPQPRNELLVIDRGNATLTWVDPATCAVLRQVNVSSGWKGNPQDAIAVGGNKLYVPRFGRNPANAAEGDDVLVLDGATGAATGRIDLSAQRATGEPQRLARPTRGLLHEGKVYLVLNHLSEDYMTAGPGKVVILDPATDTVTGAIELPTLKNCGSVTTVLGQPQTLVVSCNGVFADGPRQIDASGIATVDVSATPPAVTVLPASKFGRPVGSVPHPLTSKSLGFVIVAGTFGSMGMPGTPDELWTFDLAAGTAQKLVNGNGAFATTLFVDAAGGRLLLGDAADKTPKVDVYGLAGGAPARTGSFAPSASTGLPPRHMGYY